MNRTIEKIAVTGFLLAVHACSNTMLPSPAEAARLKFKPFVSGFVELVQNQDDPAGDDFGGDQVSSGGEPSIRPREAAEIAKSAYPGSKVLKVKLLPSGIYAVTLRGDGKLTRVMVDGDNGSIL